MTYLEKRNQGNFLLSMLDSSAQQKVKNKKQNIAYQIEDQFIVGEDGNIDTAELTNKNLMLEAKYDQIPVAAV